MESTENPTRAGLARVPLANLLCSALQLEWFGLNSSVASTLGRETWRCEIAAGMALGMNSRSSDTAERESSAPGWVGAGGSCALCL